MNFLPLFRTFAAAAAILLICASASADNRSLIEALLENGHLTEEQAAELLAHQPATVTPAGANFRDFRIRGRIQAQAGYVYSDDDDGSEDYSTLELRRVRLGAQGTLLQNVRAQVEAEFTPGSDVSLRATYLQWREYEEAFVKVGYDRPILGLERTTSSASILTVERSHLTNTIYSQYMVGAMIDGEIAPFTYGLGIYTNRDNANIAGEDGYLYNATAGWSADSWMPEEQDLRFRADVILNDDDAGLGTDDGPKFTYETAFSLSAHYSWNPFDLRAEYLFGDSFDGDATHGWYLLPSFHLTEKLQLVARYERMRSDADDGIRSPSRYARRAAGRFGDRYQALYSGANYYFSGHANKVMFGVELSELKTSTAGDQESVTIYGAWRVLF